MPGSADFGTLNDAEKVPAAEVTGVPTRVVAKSRLIFSLVPYPIPHAATWLVGGPKVGESCIHVVTPSGHAVGQDRWNAYRLLSFEPTYTTPFTIAGEDCTKPPVVAVNRGVQVLGLPEHPAVPAALKA